MKNDSSFAKLNVDATVLNQRITRNRSVASAHPSNYPNLKLFESRQSPKMESGKLRKENQLSSNQLFMPFSQLDLPIGKISKGTNLPSQYERKEMEKIFNQTAHLGFYRKNNFKENAVLNDVTSNSNINQLLNQEDKNNKNLKQSKSFYVSKEKNVSPILDNTEVNNVNNVNRKISMEVPNQSENEKSNIQLKINTIKPSKETDKWIPKNYREHERLIKTAHIRFRDPNYSSNTLGDRLPNVSVKEIKTKSQESDIFFTKNPKFIEGNNNFNKIQKNSLKSKAIDYQDSDIFMLKNNNLSLEKNAEKYLESKNKIAVYNSSSRSNSEWQPNSANASLLNHGSTKHNILNPDAKNYSKTKEQIIAESISLNNFNPIFKQKSLCEFLDLTRVGVPNPNKEYLNALKKSKNGFGREANICSTYLDLHRMYRGISDRPFVKKIV